ncbi:protein tramtrack, beta isoform isoform X2 [Solenopsis invicta]|uniref:protein tramtrack, beta isoform isoform X2 n=1 Tax=Solenopsis invicta TaxID=13686 RepID=UPI000595C98E|nr:protein tramtrack, beta isoform isoform X2 [Solenopsis invicta]
MGSSHQISLKWDHYLKHITCAFDTLRTDEDLVDVTLSCEGKRIRAHKMLLSACSTYFRDLFKENPCQHPVIIFRNVKFDDLAALVDFMYQGEVNVVQEQLASFLTTAELLAVQGLTDGTGIDDSLVEDDIEISNEFEVQLQNTSSKFSKFSKSTGDNKRNKSPSSLTSYHVIGAQPEVSPNKRRKIQESTNVNGEKNSSEINANDSDGKTSESQMGPDSDPLVIIPPIANLKVEMPEYLEQDGSSCSFEDQSIGDNTLNKIATVDTLSIMPKHGQKADISQTIYSSQSTSDGLDGKHQSDTGHLLSKPSTSRERATQDAVQENFTPFVITKIINLESAINDIKTSIKLISEKLSVDSSDKKENEYVDTLKDFPLKDQTELDTLEDKLQNDASYRHEMIKQLSRVGSGLMKTSCIRLMRLIFSNELAAKYSWYGAKKKQIFSTLHICRVIMSVIRKSHPDVTDDQISAPIKIWLAHATERITRHILKENRYENRDESRDENQDENQEDE